MLWFLNILVCLAGLRLAYRAQSVLVIFWTYSAYMSFLGLMKFGFGLIQIKLYGANPTFVHEMYLLGSNVLFLATSSFVWRNMPTRSLFHLGDLSVMRRSNLFIYATLYCLGVALYFREAMEFEYRTFVNYDDSAWTQVSFYSGATLIAILAARRNWLLALALCLPYVLLSVAISVRAFIALSLFPVLILLMISLRNQGTSTGHSPRRSRNTFTLRKLRPSTLLALAVACGVFVYTVIGASLTKHGEVTLPEEKLIETFVVVTDVLERDPVPLGTESMERFFWGLGSPIFKQFGIRYETERDPPAIFATYIENYASRSDSYFHYPALWQGDTFAAFRYAGLLLAPFWALVLISLEQLLRSKPRLWVTFLPVSCWVSFMFARGAIGNSTIGVSYVILLQIAIYLLLGLLAREPSRRATLDANSPTKQVPR